MSVGCLGEIQDRGVIEIIELVVKHEGKLRKLIKALKRCCAHCTSSSDEELKKTDEQPRADTISKLEFGLT
jgi:hypothetical protein